MGTSMIELFGTIKASTSLAVLIDFGFEEPTWVPRSMIKTLDGEPLENNLRNGTSDDWLLQEWWASDEGLI